MSDNLQIDYFFTPGGGCDVVCRPISDVQVEHAVQSDVRVIVRHHASDERVSSALTHLLADIADNGLAAIYQRPSGLAPNAANEDSF